MTRRQRSFPWREARHERRTKGNKGFNPSTSSGQAANIQQSTFNFQGNGKGIAASSRRDGKRCQATALQRSGAQLGRARWRAPWFVLGPCADRANHRGIGYNESARCPETPPGGRLDCGPSAGKPPGLEASQAVQGTPYLTAT